MNGIMGTRLLGLISALWPLTVETNAPFWPKVCKNAESKLKSALLCQI
jgi:hypothetical protein